MSELDLSIAIHMGFDCMAIGMGLIASIMATWPPNERFTYGLVTLLVPETDLMGWYSL
jgi:Co/Zn/Cd efflux system component